MITPTISLEESLWQQGYVHIAGVDEAGKGPLAGPVTAGAVAISTPSEVISMVRDSKLMTPIQREKAFVQIINKSSAYGIGIVDAWEIDTLGIDFAVQKAMMLALTTLEEKLGKPLSYVLVDGSKTKELTKYKTQRIKKGGLYHYSISAGSVLAKVTRDRIMQQYHLEFPQYGFKKHVGYGTKQHIEALQKFGPCKIHRKTFAPISSLSLHA